MSSKLIIKKPRYYVYLKRKFNVIYLRSNLHAASPKTNHSIKQKSVVLGLYLAREICETKTESLE